MDLGGRGCLKDADVGVCQKLLDVDRRTKTQTKIIKETGVWSPLRHAMPGRMPPGVSLARCLLDRPRGHPRAAPIGPGPLTSGWGTRVPINEPRCRHTEGCDPASLDRPALPSTPVGGE